MKTGTKKMNIEFDLDCMTTENRMGFEGNLIDIMKKWGWNFSSSGACFLNARTRDLQFEYSQQEKT